MIEWIFIIGGIILFFILLSGIRVIRPTQRGLVETFGKYTSFRTPGLNFVIPIFQRIALVNITERMSNIEPQEIITKDNLNARVDLVVYYKIRSDEDSVKNSVYQVDRLDEQLDTLARTTARNVIGTMAFREVNSERRTLNKSLGEILAKETKDWGVDVLKVELKEIIPPSDVQGTMNSVIKAENEKDAARDLATAAETVADGKRRAAIKEAQGLAEAKVIVAKSEAERIKLVNESAEKYFVGNAQILRRLDVTESSLKNNAKIILTDKGISPQIILGDIPVRGKTKE